MQIVQRTKERVDTGRVTGTAAAAIEAIVAAAEGLLSLILASCRGMASLDAAAVAVAAVAAATVQAAATAAAALRVEGREFRTKS